MKKLVELVVVIAAIGIGAAPAFASYPAITQKDPAGNVKILHSTYAGNQDVDIPRRTTSCTATGPRTRSCGTSSTSRPCVPS